MISKLFVGFLISFFEIGDAFERRGSILIFEGTFVPFSKLLTTKKKKKKNVQFASLSLGYSCSSRLSLSWFRLVGGFDDNI